MITPEAIAQQIELQQMYRDDQFAAKLEELKAQWEQTQNAQTELDEEKKALKERERLCEVIQNSQATFNEQKARDEAHNLTVSQRNQRVKDELAAQVIAVAKTVDEANAKLEEAEKALKSANAKKGQAEAKLRKAEDAEEAALKYKAAYEKRLAELGLKAA